MAVLAAFAMVLSIGMTQASAKPGDPSKESQGGSAQISGDFDNGCTEFEAESDKDVSNIEVFYADGTSQKYEYKGNDNKQVSAGDGRQIDYVIVKSGTKSERFDCPECQDRRDNDGDGGIDFDKDGDGQRDADSDPDCDSEDDPSESGPQPECSDGKDNDDPEDTAADADDPGCHTDGDPNNPDSYDPNDNDETDEAAKPECSDGKDNDDPEDTLADADDPGCHTDGDPNNPDSYDPNDNDETDEAAKPECSDGKDNDDPEDTLADADDPGCHTDGDPNNPDSYDPNDNDETDEPIVGGGRWTCRASALFIEALDFEPIVANDANDPCVADDGSVLNETVAGAPGSLTASAVEAETTTTGAESGVAEVTVRDAAGLTVLSAEVVQSEASGSCVNNQPVLSGKSEVLSVTIAGQTFALTEGETFTQDFGPLGVLHVNYQESGPTADGGTELVQRAIFLDNNVLLGDVIIAESVVDVHGNPCAAQP